MAEPTDISPKPPAYEKVYLGNGVYAHFDGYHIWLTTPNQGAYNQIALEDEVFQRLVGYRTALYENMTKELEIATKVFAALDHIYSIEGSNMFETALEDEAHNLIIARDGLKGQRIGHLMPIIEEWRAQRKAKDAEK